MNKNISETIWYIIFVIIKAIFSGLIYKYCGFELTIIILLTLIQIDCYWKK